MWPWLFGSPCAQLVYLGDLSEILKIVNKHTRPPSRLTRQPKTPPSVRQSIPSRTVCADCSTWASTTTAATTVITITILFPTRKKPEWSNLVPNCLVLVRGINLNQLGALINNHGTLLCNISLLSGFCNISSRWGTNCLMVALVESVGQGVWNLSHNFFLPWMHALDNTLLALVESVGQGVWNFRNVVRKKRDYVGKIPKWRAPPPAPSPQFGKPLL